MPFYQELPKDADIFEGCPEHVILAKVDGYDLLFWISAYILDGRTPDGFLAEDAAALCTMLVMVPQKERGRMNDNDFICRGFTPFEYLKTGDLKVTPERDKVVWKIKNTEFVCHPPYWEVRGSNEGIEYALEIIGTAPASWYAPGWDNIPEMKQANFNQFTFCTGSISVGGKTYEISNGYGCHEHPVIINSFDAEALRQPLYWFNGGGDELQFFTFGWGDSPEWYARVLVEGKYLAYENVTLDILEWWHDPRSLATIPCKWHLNMRSADGILDVHAVASGRANRVWCQRSSYALDVWILGTVNGSFLYPDGHIIPIKDMLFMVEWLRAIWP